jgi:bacterioferritin
LTIGPLLDSHKHDIGAIMRESLETEGKALTLYRELLAAIEGRSVMLEEYARQMIYAEEMHADEVDKMLRKPGELAAFRHD